MKTSNDSGFKYTSGKQEEEEAEGWLRAPLYSYFHFIIFFPLQQKLNFTQLIIGPNFAVGFSYLHSHDPNTSTERMENELKEKEKKKVWKRKYEGT